LSLALEMTMAPRVGLEVSPALVAFSEMLILPCVSMESLIDRELCANAALERLDAGECPVCRGASPARCPVCAAAIRRGRRPELADVSDRAAAEPDTHALLRAVRIEIDAADGPIAERLIDSLDEHGFLDRSCAQLAAELGVDEVVVERVLAVVRGVGPPGVGARGVAECLLLQLDALGVRDELARAVIADHLHALARGHFSSIAQAVGTSRARIQLVLDLIRERLRPYPAFDGNAPRVTSYVVPDMVVSERDGAFVVELVEPAMTRLAVRRSGAPEASVSRARSFLAQLHDRWNTLRRVAELAVEHQREFLLGGETELRPLTRAEVALELGVHESTVSRAVADKHALLPDGTIVPLSRFFGVSGGVDGALRRLLESAGGSLSDQQLADRLGEAGYPIARRTVAKHRARLGYGAASLR
jgi:RNA polymerase sigma-54 factor